MPVVCDNHRSCAGKRSLSAWQAFSWLLFFGCGGDCLRPAENENYRHVVFLVWNNGRAGGKHPGPWLCGDAYDSFAPWRMCVPGGMDIYGFQVGQNPADALYFLSHILGAYGGGSPDLFYCGIQEIKRKKLSWKRSLKGGRFLTHRHVKYILTIMSIYDIYNIYSLKGILFSKEVTNEHNNK